jgi:hypothetical protein
MWQIYAMMAQDQIREQLQQADQRRRSQEQPRPIRQRRHVHLPAVRRHPAHPSTRTV